MAAMSDRHTLLPAAYLLSRCSDAQRGKLRDILRPALAAVVGDEEDAFALGTQNAQCLRVQGSGDNCHLQIRLPPIKWLQPQIKSSRVEVSGFRVQGTRFEAQSARVKSEI